MNWKFWKSKEYKPSLVERVAAYHWFIRILATLPLFAIIAAIIWFVLSINLEGVQLIQATDKIAKIMEVGTIIPTVALVVIVAFIGMTGGARAELIIISMLATAFLTTAYEGVQVWKSRAATIIEQDIGAENHDDAEKAINDRIKAAQESADFYKAELNKAQNRKCFKWEQLECDKNVSKNNEAFQKKGEEVAALKAEKLKLPKKKPTESLILGRELSQFMAGALVVILLAIKSICSTLLGAIVASFSIHKAKKFVRENTNIEAVKRHEAPIANPNAPKAPAKAPVRPVSPVAKPMQPDAPKMGDVEVPAVVRGAALATLLGAGAPATSLAANDGIMPSTEAVAVQTDTGMGQKAPETPELEGGMGGMGSSMGGMGSSMGGMGVGSGSGMGSVGVEKAPEPVPPVPEEKSVSVVSVTKPRVKYADFASLLHAAREGIEAGK